MPQRHAFGVALFVFFGMLSATGCTTSMIGLGGDKDVDSSTITSTVSSTHPSTDPEAQSDALTVRNAISAADLSTLDSSPLAWANTQTGSRGAISGVTEVNEQGVVCRKFTTTRERFDGIALYEGRACMVAPGMWQMTAFAPA